MRSLLSQFQTPTAPRKSQSVFSGLVAHPVALQSGSPSLLRIGNFLFSPTLSAIDGCHPKQLLHGCQCPFSVHSLKFESVRATNASCCIVNALVNRWLICSRFSTGAFTVRTEKKRRRADSSWQGAKGLPCKVSSLLLPRADIGNVQRDLNTRGMVNFHLSVPRSHSPVSGDPRSCIGPHTDLRVGAHCTPGTESCCERSRSTCLRTCHRPCIQRSSV